MKHFKYILLGTLILLIPSCTEYLDVKPKGKIIPETAEDFSTILHYWLDRVETGQDEEILGNATNLILQEFYSDNLDATLASLVEGFTINGYTPLYIGERINSVQNEYSDNYSVIKDCNMIIGEMKDTKSELAKQLLGTAWAIRSICYYNLLIRFCEPYNPISAEDKLGLPLIDRFDMEAKPSRSDLKTTVSFIEEGFKNAIRYDISDTDYIFTSDVAKAYLTKLYFWTQQWEKAIQYAEELLSKYPMLEANQYEEVMQNKFTQSSNFILNPYTSESSLGSMAVTNAFSDSKTRPVSREMAESFSEKNDDIRYTVAFNKKRVNNKTILFRIRSEEMCLIAAGSYAHLNDTENAIRQLNALREKRIIQNFIPYTEKNLPEIYSQLITEDATGKPIDKLMSAILCERRKEFYIEGDRWFELKRNGRPEFWVANNGKKYVNEKYLYTYPINKSDIDLYPGLVIQNPGYEE